MRALVIVEVKKCESDPPYEKSMRISLEVDPTSEMMSLCLFVAVGRLVTDVPVRSGVQYVHFVGRARERVESVGAPPVACLSAVGGPCVSIHNGMLVSKWSLTRLHQDAAITWIATFDPPVSEAVFNYSGNAYMYAPGGTVNCYNSTPNNQCWSATTVRRPQARALPLLTRPAGVPVQL
jgi:hypothetical protein